MSTNPLLRRLRCTATANAKDFFVVRPDRAGIMRSFFFVGKFSAPFAAELSSENREICNSQVSFIHHD